MANPKVNIIKKTENAGGDNSGGDGDKPKKKIPGWVLILIPVMAIVWGGGAFAIKKIMDHQRFMEEEALRLKKEAEEAEKKLIKTETALIDPFTISLIPEGENLKHLEIQFAVEIPNPRTKMDLYEKMDQIRDDITMFLSTKSEKELKKVDARKKLQEELLSHINRILQKGKASQVYYTNFLIQ